MSQMPIQIEVTPQDIAQGIPNDCRHCALGISIARKVKPGVDVSVMDCNVSLWDERSSESAYPSLPKVARDFIRLFDKHETVKPLTFALEIPAVFLA